MGTRIQKENATNRALTLAKQKKGKWNKEVSVREKTFENKTANRKLGRHSTGLHCSSSHTKHQSHKCKKCDKSFGCAYSLWRHDIIHSDKRPYKCKYCGKSFNDSGNCRKYGRLHESFKQLSKFESKRARNANLTVSASCTTWAFTVQNCNASANESENCWVCQRSFGREALQNHYEKGTCILELLFSKWM